MVLGSEAVAIGLVHRSFPREQLLTAATEYARDLAQHCSPLAMGTAKRQVYLDWERSLLESRGDARRLVGALKRRSGDFREGVRSFVERRPPAFEPVSAPVDRSDYEETP